MSIKIEHKIIGYDIAKPKSHESTSPNAEPEHSAESDTESPHSGGKIIRMHEKVQRPEMLVGSTYKIKTPTSEHAFYITINDMVLNSGTPYEKQRPFEMFINSKNMDHYQWISALTRIISAVFRKGGDIAFLVDELQSIFDPKGGYFRKGGKYVPSIVAEIGDALESHLKMLGLITTPQLDKHQQKMVDQHRKKFEQQTLNVDPEHKSESFPEGAELCNKCHNKSMVIMDNCLTCLNCGESKCN